MRAVSRVAASALTLGVAAVVATGCGQSEADAEAALCADLASLRSSVETLRDTSRFTTVEEFNEARENVRGAWADTRDSAANLGSKRTDDLDDAWEDLEDAIDGIDDDASLAEAKAEVATAIDTYNETANDIRSGLDCSDAEGDDSNG
jgi:hypothetical protein